MPLADIFDLIERLLPRAFELFLQRFVTTDVQHLALLTVDRRRDRVHYVNQLPLNVECSLEDPTRLVRQPLGAKTLNGLDELIVVENGPLAGSCTCDLRDGDAHG